MADLMILASTIRAGKAYARDHRIPLADVITPGSHLRACGRHFEDVVIIGEVKLTHRQYVSIARSFLTGTKWREIHPELKKLVTYD